MDVFDDILPGAPIARSKPGGKFAPKVKLKKLPQKEISASEHASPLTNKDSEGISQNECHNAVAAHPLQVELQNKENAANSELGNSKQVCVDRDNAPLVDNLPFTTAEVVADQNTANFPKSAPRADSMDFEVGFVPKSILEKLKKSADSPTLDDFLQQNDANERKTFLRKLGSSSITGADDEGGKTSRQLRRQAARKCTNNPLNEDVEDDDVLDPPYNSNRDEVEENGDEYELDYSSKRKRASTSSKKKPVPKTEKTSRKRKKANDDLDKTTKEPKFSRSTRRRRRRMDKDLLENDELDCRTLPLRVVILIADYKERLAKKKATTSTTNQSDGDFFHEAGANIEEDIFDSEDGRDLDDDHASERTTPTNSLLNNQSFLDKAPRGKWSKQDTEKFYEAIRKIGLDFSVIQYVCFPGKTPHQLKLKYKKEDRQNHLRLSDALRNRLTDNSHYFKSRIEELQQASSKEELGPSKDASEFMLGENVEDLTPGINEEVGIDEQEKVATDKQDDAKVNEDFAAFHSPEQSDDDSDDELQRLCQYKSVF